MKIPDFSIPTEDCFLTTDKNGVQLKVGDVIASLSTPLRGFEKQLCLYEPIEDYKGNLIIKVKPSHLLNYYVKGYCELFIRL